MYKIKDSVDLKELEKILSRYGYSRSHVAVFPKALVKVVDLDKKYIIEICDSEPSYNMWTGKDWTDSKVLKLWECEKLDLKSNFKILLEPEIGEHLYYRTTQTHNDLVEKYAKDLIKADLVEKIEIKK